MPGTPRVILALANHAHSAGWDRAKVLQREMFQAAAGSGLEMKFAFYGADDAAGVRRCRITTRWITDPDDMAGVMDRAECNCGCYVNIRDVLAQAVKENEDRPLRAVIIVGDVFHDDQDGLDEAAISANRAASGGDAGVPDPAGRRSRHCAQAPVLGQGFGRRVFPVRSEDTGTAILGDVAGGVGLCRGRRGGREDDGRASGDPAAATSQAGADANHRGARSRAGGLRHQGMTSTTRGAGVMQRKGDDPSMKGDAPAASLGRMTSHELRAAHSARSPLRRGRRAARWTFADIRTDRPLENEPRQPANMENEMTKRQMQGCEVLEIDGVDPKRALLELRDGKHWDGEPATRKEDGTTPMPDGFYFVELTSDGKRNQRHVYGPYASA